MVEKQRFDIAIIGAGPAGYVAAIKASQMGRKVALIERKCLGGTCLNVGCIPSKTLLANAQILRQVRRSEDYGIKVDGISFDYSKMKARKDRVVERIKSSLNSLITSNNITIIHGNASFLSPSELKVRGGENVWIEADKVIIATGSEPVDMPAFPCDHRLIRNSTSILDLDELPKSIAIIGGGYIGCEFASLFAAFGVKVSVIETLPRLVQAQGKTLSEQITKAFITQGIDIKTKKSVESIQTRKEGLLIQLEDGERLESDMALVSIGRHLVSEGLGLERAGLATTSRGAIEVNERLETPVPGIYAIGDITAVAMLAHVASHQGMIAAMNACGQKAHIDYRAIPAVIFTHPEMATVGLTAEQAEEKGYQTSVGTYPFQALGKSIATDDTEGFAQVVSDKKTGEILGAQVMGHGASVLIAEMALAINNELTLECITETIHAHPTLSEAWLEATLLANHTPIHFPPKVRSERR